jgi:predicted transcriptional regulator
MKKKSPCEEVVWDVLPNIRAEIAEDLVKRGVSQREISRMLGLTQPAVSQYVSKKRGYSIEFSEGVKESIAKLAEDLIQNQVEDPLSRICEICKEMRGEESACGSRGCR